MKKRNSFLDFAKGIAIVLVVLGHVVQKSYGLNGIGGGQYSINFLYKSIYAFHMPLFMIISGYFFYYSVSRYDCKTLIIRKIRQQLIPVLIWNSIYYFLSLLFSHESFIIKDYLMQLSTGLWFIWVIFTYSVMLALIFRFVNRKYQWIAIILMMPIMLISPNRWSMLFEYPIFLLGFFACKYKERVRLILRGNIPKMICIAGVLLHVIYVFFLPGVSLNYKFLADSVRSGVFSDVIMSSLNLVYRYILSCSSLFAAIYVIKKIYVLFGNAGIITRRIENVGHYTMEIYILQRLILELVLANLYNIFINSVGENILLRNIYLLDFIIAPIIALILIIIFMCIIKLIKNISPLNALLFGKSS